MRVNFECSGWKIRECGVAVRFGTAFLSIVFPLFFLTGCPRRQPPSGEALPEVTTNRMADAAYRAGLAELRREQARLAGGRSEVVERMRVMIDRVRSELPEGADEAAVRAALAKDPEWNRLENANQEMIGKIGDNLAQARERVRQRMLAEERDNRKVAEGTARPAAGVPAAP